MRSYLSRQDVRSQRSLFQLSDEDRERYLARLGLAVKRARQSGEQTLATISLELPPQVDPSAVVCASRREDMEHGKSR